MRKSLALLVGALLAVPVTFAQTTSTDRLTGLSASLAVKAPVKAVTTANITLSGQQTIDGTAVVAGDRVLVKDQTSAVDNGIYLVSTSDWQRAADFDGARDVVKGTIVLRHGNGVFQVTSSDPITIGTSSIAFAQRVIETTADVAVTDYGLIANNAGVAAANTTALKALVSPPASGGTYTLAGRVTFPNPGGADIYYFGPTFIEVRDDIAIDCQGATLNFSGSYAAANDSNGFLTFIRDVTIENCNIVVNYDGTAGVNNGMALRIGGRAATYGFGAFRPGLEEEDFTVRMGNIAVRNTRITTNNPDSPAVLILGGLENTLLEDVIIDGSDLAPEGISYEFGQWHYEGGAAGAANISTHATNLRFRSVRVVNVTGAAVHVVGAMTFFLDGLWVDDAANVFVARLGEAGYYNMTGTPTNGMKAHYDLRNVNGKNIDSTGISLLGSESLLAGYLGTTIAALDPIPEAQAQTDKITFNLDGFYLANSSIIVNAPHVRIANGTQRGSLGRGIWLQSETLHFEIDNVNLLGNTSGGIASDTGGQIYTTARFRNGSIRNCFVAGTLGGAAGIALSQMDGVLIEACRFGYELAHDGLDEPTQGAGVSNQATTKNLTIRNSYGGGTTTTMFINAGSGGWKFAKLENVGGIKTTSGQWSIDGDGIDADIGDANTTLDVGTDLPTQRYATTLTANRTVTCGTGNVYNGAKFTVIRTGLGAFSLDICGLRTIANSTAATVTVIHDGTAWRLSSYSAH